MIKNVNTVRPQHPAAVPGLPEVLRPVRGHLQKPEKRLKPGNRQNLRVHSSGL